MGSHVRPCFVHYFKRLGCYIYRSGLRQLEQLSHRRHQEDAVADFTSLQRLVQTATQRLAALCLSGELVDVKAVGAAPCIFDGIQSAAAKKIQLVLGDTAGRLQNKSNLMEELKKVRRVIGKLDADAPHEVLLVLDAGTGQNAINQAKQFNQTVNLTGLALTKLDGTAKGGVIFALAKQFVLPIRYIGVGEGIDDLRTFEAEAFVQALFAEK